ncbi:hypothetical protein LTR82_010080 [Friedmanniomyces endolithicus]|uniref:Flavin reductase like domain-containing protein n=1 Tax=Friedmanniomyces endolithicus TaxID=329885 RepID=A0AAN6FIE6_9PEZI|nr:hypothetical protein LTR82_010080 [Friedmanniomyces endolithicus]
MSPRTSRSTQLYAAFYRWTLLTSQRRCPYSIRQAALFSATVRPRQNDHQVPIRRVHRDDKLSNGDGMRTSRPRRRLAVRDSTNNTKLEWRTQAVENTADRPFKALKAWDEAVRYRSENGIMLELAVPGERAVELRRKFGVGLQGLNNSTGARLQMGSLVQSADGARVTSLLISGSFDEVTKVMQNLADFRSAKTVAKGAVPAGERRPPERLEASDPALGHHSSIAIEGVGSHLAKLDTLKTCDEVPSSAIKPWAFVTRARSHDSVTYELAMPEDDVQDWENAYGEQLWRFLRKQSMNGVQVSVAPTSIHAEDHASKEVRCLILSGRSLAVDQLLRALRSYRNNEQLRSNLRSRREAQQDLPPWKTVERKRTRDSTTFELAVPAARLDGFRKIWGTHLELLTLGKYAGVNVSSTPSRMLPEHGEVCSLVIVGPQKVAERACHAIHSTRDESHYLARLSRIGMGNFAVLSYLELPSEYVTPGQHVVRSAFNGGTEGSVEFVLDESGSRAFVAIGGLPWLRKQVREGLDSVELGPLRDRGQQLVRSIFAAGKMNALGDIRRILKVSDLLDRGKGSSATGGVVSQTPEREVASMAVAGGGTGKQADNVAANGSPSAQARKPTAIAGTTLEGNDYFAAASAADFDDEPDASSAAEHPGPSSVDVRARPAPQDKTTNVAIVPISSSRVHIMSAAWTTKHLTGPDGRTRSRLLRQSGAANMHYYRKRVPRDQDQITVVDGSEETFRLAAQLITEVIAHAECTLPYQSAAAKFFEGRSGSAPKKYFAHVGMPGATTGRKCEFVAYLMGTHGDDLSREAVRTMAFVEPDQVGRRDGSIDVWAYEPVDVERLAAAIGNTANHKPDVRDGERDGVVILGRWVEGARGGQGYERITEGWEVTVPATTGISETSGRVGVVNSGVGADVARAGDGKEERLDAASVSEGGTSAAAVSGDVAHQQAVNEPQLHRKHNSMADTANFIVSKWSPRSTKADGVQQEVSKLANHVRTVSRTLTHSVAIVTSRAPTSINSTASTTEDYTDDWLAQCRGVTVSSFTTLSLHPVPVVTFNLKVPSGTWDAIAASGRLFVHLLAATPKAAGLAHHFSLPHAKAEGQTHTSGKSEGSKPPSRFHIPLRLSRQDVLSSSPIPPRITSDPESVFARLEGALLREKCVKVGDHVLVVAEVRRVSTRGQRWTTVWDQNESERALEEVVGLGYGKRAYRAMGEAVEREEMKVPGAASPDAVGEDVAEEDVGGMTLPEVKDTQPEMILPSGGATSQDVINEAGSEPDMPDTPSESKTSRRNAVMEEEEEEEYDLGFGNEAGRPHTKGSESAPDHSASKETDNVSPTIRTYRLGRRPRGGSFQQVRIYHRNSRGSRFRPSILNATVGEFLGQTGVITSRGRMQGLLKAKGAATLAARELEEALADGSLTPERSLELERTIAVNERFVARKLAFRAASELSRMLDTGKVDVRRSQWLEAAVEKGMAICVEDGRRARQGYDEGRIDEERFAVMRERLGVDFGRLNTEALRLRDMVDEEGETGGAGETYGREQRRE